MLSNSWIDGVTGHLSVGPNDVWANGKSYEPVISGDGLYVAYASRATNLITLDSNATDDIFTHFWADPGRTQCDTQRRSKPIPVPLPFARLPSPPKPDYDRKCQDSIPSQNEQDPAPNLTEAQWYNVFDTFTAASSYQGINPVRLRWGNTWKSPIRGWKGWGYRKIKVKHGWSAQIRTNVAAALAAPPAESEGTEWVYQTEYTYKGSTCIIRVVVEYGQRPLEASKGYPAAHILTAYAWKKVF